MAKPVFRGFRRPRLGRFLVMWQNLFINLVLPMGVVRHLPRSVMATYRAPFRHVEDRYPILVWPNELPLDDQRGETREVIEGLEQRLPQMEQRLLLLYFKPGALIRKRQVEWLQSHVPHLETRYGGPGLHYVQEDSPDRIAKALRDWLASSGAATKASRQPAPGSEPRFHWRRLEHRGEPMVAVWSERGLAGLGFVDPEEDPETAAQALVPDAEPVEAPEDVTDWLDPATPVDWTGTNFQQKVWEALQTIPPGETRSYKDIAQQIGSQPRAVGQAVRANRLALRVPCHRVVPGSGGVGAFRWGAARKRRLLDAEQAG